MTKDDDKGGLFRARIRWHAEMGVNGFDHLRAEVAAWNAERSLQSICRILDEAEDGDRTARILKMVGLEKSA